YLTPVFITSSRATPTLPSFPTRRSSDLAGSLLQQDRADAFLRQAERRRQAADAAAGDQYRSDVHQPDFPRCSSASSARSGTRDDSLLRSTSCVISASKVLRSAGFSGCSIRACAFSTAGMISR